MGWWRDLMELAEEIHSRKWHGLAHMALIPAVCSMGGSPGFHGIFPL